DPGPLAVAVDHHDVGDVNGRLVGLDAAGLRAASPALLDLGVLPDPVDALDEDLVLTRVGRDHHAPGALVLAGDDLDGVPLLHLHSEHLRRQRDDLHEALVAQLPTDGPEDAGTARVATVAEQHGGVLVEPDVRPVRPPLLLGGTDHHRPDDVALLDTRARDRVLDRRHDLVADARVAAT